MEKNKTYTLKNILLTTMWLLIGVATTVLLVAAIKNNDSKICKKVEINIYGIKDNTFKQEKFVNENDVLNTIKSICEINPVGKAIGSFNLKKIETEIGKSPWVKNAELFFDNNEVLKVTVQERNPVARLFSTATTSFYIDSTLKILPLSQKLSASLPVFTNFPSDKMVLTLADSNILKQVRDISMAIQKDTFCKAMIDQIDITPQHTFDLIPKLGNQIIAFGDANDIDEKLTKLKLFYKNIQLKYGWNKYSEINLQYKNQVVAKRRGAEDKTADSARTIQILQMIAVNAAKQAQDSIQTIEQDNSSNTADSSIIDQSIQREDNTELVSNVNDKIQSNSIIPPIPKPIVLNRPVIKAPIIINKVLAKPIVKKTIVIKPKPIQKSNNVAPTKKTIIKTKLIVKKPATKKSIIQKPKIVMPNKNDY